MNKKPTSPKLTREEELQAYSDGLFAIVTAVAWQLDPIRLIADFKLLADIADRAGHGPSAGLIDAFGRTIEARVIGKKTH